MAPTSSKWAAKRSTPVSTIRATMRKVHGSSKSANRTTISKLKTRSVDSAATGAQIASKPTFLTELELMVHRIDKTGSTILSLRTIPRFNLCKFYLLTGIFLKGFHILTMTLKGVFADWDFKTLFNRIKYYKN